MPTILRDLPYFKGRSSVTVSGRAEPVKPTQIIIWASITGVDQDEFDPATPRLPAILDTGLSHNFAISEELLSRWAGLDVRHLSKMRDIRLGDRPVPLHEAEVWLHANRPGQRDSFADRPPFRLRIPTGIAVYPRGMITAPRLPLLGLRALEWMKLRLLIDCEHRRVWLRTPRRFWFFGY